MVGNPYIEVAKSYICEWDRRIAGGLLLFFLMFAGVHADRTEIGAWPLLPILIPFGYLANSVANLIKEQFANPRARLLPGFAKRHLLVAAVTTGAACLLVSCVLTIASAASMFAMLAVTLGIYAILFWSSLKQTLAWVLPVAVIPLLYGSIPVRVATALLRGDMPGATIIALGLSLLALGILGIKLFGLNEDQPEYYKRFGDGSASYRKSLEEQFGPGGLRPGESFVAGIPSRWRDRRLASILSVPITSCWQDMRRLRAATGHSSLVGACVPVMLGIWITNRFTGSKVEPSLPLFMIVFIMLFIYSCVWKRVLVQEMLRPVTRQQLLLRAGLALAIEYVKAWCGFCVMVTLIFAVESPALLRNRETWMAFGVLFCALIPTFGIVVRLLLLRSEATRFFIMMVMGMVIATFMIAVPSAEACVLTAIAMVAVGIVIMWCAYRAWLKADLD